MSVDRSIATQAKIIGVCCGVAAISRAFAALEMERGYFDEIDKAIWLFVVLAVPTWLCLLLGGGRKAALSVLGILYLLCGFSYLFTGGWSSHL